MSRLQKPGFGPRRAGERAPLVPKDLALHQMLGQGPAVERHERPPSAPAVGVNTARDQLLARAARAADEHVDIRIGDLLDRLEDLGHRRALANDVVEAEMPAQLLPQAAILLAQHPLGQRLLHRDHQMLWSERLGHEVVGSQAHRLDRVLDGAVRGHHDHLNLRVQLLDLRQQFHAVHARHLQIGDHQVRLFLLNGLHGLFAVGRHPNLVSLALEQALAAHRQIDLVVDYEYALICHLDLPSFFAPSRPPVRSRADTARNRSLLPIDSPRRSPRRALPRYRS